MSAETKCRIRWCATERAHPNSGVIFCWMHQNGWNRYSKRSKGATALHDFVHAVELEERK